MLIWVRFKAPRFCGVTDSGKAIIALPVHHLEPEELEADGLEDE